MCWSRDVTLFFVILELSCMALLGCRGERWMLVFMTPLVLQEAVQYAIWLSVEAGESAGLAPRSCTPANTYWSLIEQFVVICVTPLLWRVWSQRSIRTWSDAMRLALARERETARTQPAEESAAKVADGSSIEEEGASLLSVHVDESDIDAMATRLHGALMPWALLVAFCGACIGVTNWLVAAGQWTPFCTLRGPRGGHQLWPFIQPPLPAAIDHIILRWLVHGALAFGYLLTLSTPLAAYRGEASAEDTVRRGWLPVQLLGALGPLFIVPLWLLYGMEFGSVWCWLASTTIVGAVVEPWLIAWAHAWRADEEGTRMAADWTSRVVVIAPAPGEPEQRTLSWKTVLATQLLAAIAGPAVQVRVPPSRPRGPKPT